MVDVSPLHQWSDQHHHSENHHVTALRHTRPNPQPAKSDSLTTFPGSRFTESPAGLSAARRMRRKTLIHGFARPAACSCLPSVPSAGGPAPRAFAPRVGSGRPAPARRSQRCWPSRGRAAGCSSAEVRQRQAGRPVARRRAGPPGPPPLRRRGHVGAHVGRPAATPRLRPGRGAGPGRWRGGSGCHAAACSAASTTDRGRPADRQERLDGPTFVARRRVRGSALVVDDVVTTGATLRAAEAVLREAGARACPLPCRSGNAMSL